MKMTWMYYSKFFSSYMQESLGDRMNTRKEMRKTW